MVPGFAKPEHLIALALALALLDRRGYRPALPGRNTA
jgi:hypothetical protein